MLHIFLLSTCFFYDISQWTCLLSNEEHLHQHLSDNGIDDNNDSTSGEEIGRMDGDPKYSLWSTWGLKLVYYPTVKWSNESLMAAWDGLQSLIKILRIASKCQDYHDWSLRAILTNRKTWTPIWASWCVWESDDSFSSIFFRNSEKHRTFCQTSVFMEVLVIKHQYAVPQFG